MPIRLREATRRAAGSKAVSRRPTKGTSRRATRKGQTARAGQGGGLQGRQKALRQKLGQLQKQMRDMGLDGEKGFDAAGQAMKDAEDALGEGSDGTDRAVEAQGRALRALQQGAQGLAKQMAQGQQGDGEGQQDSEEGEGQDDGTGDRTGMDSDPSGSPASDPWNVGSRPRIGSGPRGSGSAGSGGTAPPPRRPLAPSGRAGLSGAIAQALLRSARMADRPSRRRPSSSR